MLKKLGYKKEPKLRVHKYVVTVSRSKKDGWHSAFKYCVSLNEVKQVCDKASVGSIIEIYKADHNFVQAYQVVASK